MAEPETESTDISLRAAEVVADVSETDQPQERRRAVSAFLKAATSGARSGARVATSGARAAGRGTRVVQRRASEGTAWLADQVVAMAPRLRVRDHAALRAQFPGKSPDEIADAIIEGAARAAAATGGAAGMASALPVLPAFPAEIAAETLVLVGIELKLVAELHEAYASPAPGKFPERMSAYVAAWTHRRGVFMIEGGLLLAAGAPRWPGCCAGGWWPGPAAVRSPSARCSPAPLRARCSTAGKPGSSAGTSSVTCAAAP